MRGGAGVNRTRTVSDVLRSGARGPQVAAWVGPQLFAAARDGEVWAETARVDREGRVTAGGRVGCGLVSDPVLALGHTLLDVFAGRPLHLSPDPLSYGAQLDAALAVSWVPEDPARSAALTALLRRMSSFAPAHRPPLAECELVWARCFPAAVRSQGRELWLAAFESAARPWPEGVREVRRWGPDDEARLAVYRTVAHPVLRRIERVVSRGDGVTGLVLEGIPPAEILENRIGAPLRERLRMSGVLLRVAEAVADLHAADLAHGGVISRSVSVAGSRVILDGFRLGDRPALPTDEGQGPIDADRYGLGAMLTELLTGDVLRFERRPDRRTRYTVELGAERSAPRLPPSRTLGDLRELARAAESGGLDAATFAARLGAEVEKIRASFRAELTEAAPPALVLPELPG